MDWKSNLRRTQSLRSVSSSCDKPTRTEAGLRDKITSVSQLVSRYQTTKEVSASPQAPSVNNGEVKLKQVFKEITPSLVESRDIYPATQTKRSYEGERSQAKPGLTRSRSMGSLQKGAGSIEALKARFESTENNTATQAGVRSGFRAAEFTSPYKAAGITPLMNGEAGEVKRSAEEQKTRNPPVNDTDAKEDHVTRKVVNQSRAVRRKTIGGIDFERIAAYQDDEKRSVADFRDSSFFQSKEKLSVKVLSALYLSKVAPQEPKLAQDRSPESGKRVKITKMAEDPQQRKDDHPPPPLPRHQPGPADSSEERSQKSMSAQISKEKLHQQRQKCELKRLMKHTHPELKMLDEAVDEELAEVLSSESGVTAGETGYEGEVFSRRLIFENCALSSKVSPHTPKTHMADGKVGEGFVGKTSAVIEDHEERPCHESAKGIVQDYKTFGSSPEPDRECQEEMIRIDVQASRRIFESQSVKTSRPNPDMFRGKASILGEERGPVRKQKQKFEMSCKENEHSENKSLDFTDQPHKQGPCVHVDGESTGLKFSGGEDIYTDEAAFENDPTSPTVQGEFEEIIKTGAALLKNNPFISTNIERENPSESQIPANPSEASGGTLITNVKDRAHLFESMPFDKIRRQNKDEIETMVENIRETLNSLYRVNALHSDGSIIEVNETMIAKKAKFTLSEIGPEIKYNELAEGGAKNFIVQLLPRANLRPHITYLKEDRKGGTEATVVNAPVHQDQFTTSQDTEFKTANVLQLVEDILHQDNSLRKGVIIQEDANKCANVMVYSLYNYVDEEDVKSYRAPPRHAAELDEPETKEIHISKTENQGLRKGIIESTISSLLENSQDQTCTGSTRPEVTVKGNVQLFKSCIEKGDLEYLKTLQAEPIEQEQEADQNPTLAEQNAQHHHEQGGEQAEESSIDWVPVDVKRLKSMFSVDRQSQAKQNIRGNRAPSTTISHTCTGQNVPLGKSQSCKESNIGLLTPGVRKDNVLECGGQEQEEVCNFPTAPQGSHQHLETQEDDGLHQAQILGVVDNSNKISNLQTAIHSLQQATIEAKYLYHSSQNKRAVQQSSGQRIVSVKGGDVKELCRNNEDQKVASDPKMEEVPSASNFISDKNTEMCHKGSNSEEVQTTETCSKQGQKYTNVVQKNVESIADCSGTQREQEEDEVDFHGKLQQALASLERSNINVTRGDFKAAMIYKNSSRSHKDKSKASVQKPVTEEPSPLTESISTHVHLRQEDSEEQLTAVNSNLQNKPATTAVSEKGKRPVGVKPAIPPKPEHLKEKQIDGRSSNPINPELTQTNVTRTEIKGQSKEETVAQPPTTFASCSDGHMKHQSPQKSGADTGSYSGNYKGEAIQISQKTSQFQGSFENTNKNTFDKPEEMISTAEIKSPQELNLVKDNMNESDESPINFNEACQKFGGKKSKTAPVKPKRVKIAHLNLKPQQTITNPSDTGTNTSLQTADKQEREIKQENKVEMREKRGRTETDDELRQRLSVHMDEIVRGNMTAAMDIFDNLRKQEELQSILRRVEDIEQDTSEVDVRSLRSVFEDVPDWVVSSDKKKQKKVKVEHKEEKSLLKDDPQSKSSMAHIFGDLERASEEIMNLKEQTIARLLDIEEAIKKALYSVSTLKSDSDIVGLSCLFKESLGTMQGSPSNGNISKISIGSSRKLPQAQENPTTKESPTGQGASNAEASAKQQASPPSSPAFISIQSATRKMDKTDVFPAETTICPKCQKSPKSEEKFLTTKTLTCNSPAQNRKMDPRKGGQKQPSHSPLDPKRELSVLEVQTDHEGKSIRGTKTIKDNYEQTDDFGNRIYSSTTSTVVTTKPETTT